MRKKKVTEEENNKIAIYAGGLYRYNDALIPVIKLDAYQMGIGLSYDVNISKLSLHLIFAVVLNCL